MSPCVILHLCDSRQGSVVDFCEHGNECFGCLHKGLDNEPLGVIKGREFFLNLLKPSGNFT
jgi:hypothetical protein